MSVVRKVQPRLEQKKEPVQTERANVATPSRPAPSTRDQGDKRTGPVKKKVCFFCKHKIEPNYIDAAALRKFTNDRGRIYPRLRSGSCAKHQRRLSKEVKHARHLALLPFIIRV